MKKVFLVGDDFFALLETMLQSPQPNGSIILEELYLQQFQMFLKENFTMKILEENVFALFYVVLFPQVHFLYKPFNDIILFVVQSGLIDYWERIRFPPNFLLWKPQETADPVVLTWDHLYIGFYIWLFCIAVSAAAFVAEIAYHWYVLLMDRLRSKRTISA